MKRKLFIALIVIVGLWFLLKQLGIISSKQMYFDAIPQSAIMVLEINDIQQTHKKLMDTNYWLDMQNIELVSKIESTYKMLDTLFLYKTPDMEKRLVASLHLSRADEYDYILYLHRSALGTSMEKLIAALEQKGVKASQRNFRGTQIYDLKLPNSNQKFTIANDGKLVICSFEPILVEESLSQYSTYWGGLSRPSGENDASHDALMHINYQNIPFLETVFLKETIQNSVFDQLQDLLKWSQVGFDFQKRQMILDGKTQFNDDHELIAALTGQGAASKADLPVVLPFNTAFLIHERVNKFSSFNRKLGGEMKSIFNQYFLDWMGNEWAYGFTEPLGEDHHKESFIVAEVTDKELARSQMSKLFEGNPRENAAPFLFQGYSIVPANAKPIAAHLFGDRIAEHFEDAWFSVIDNYAVFAPNVEQVKVFVQKYIAEQTLNREEGYIQFSQTLDKSSNMVVYLHPLRLKQLLSVNASKSFSKLLETKYNYYKRLGPVAVQMDKSGGKVTTNGIIGYDKQAVDQTTLIWNVQLEAPAIITPQVMTNHLTKGKEVIVQDENYNLYLISDRGSILWKRPLDREILGEIYQVDFLNNGELQYMFNTKSEIFLVDREGKDIYEYPKRLSTAANTGMGVAKFDRQKEYHFFIPCGNNKVYGYEYSGRPMTHWDPRDYLALVIFPLQHFIEAEKDYILAVNENGNVYMLNFEGELIHKISLGSRPISAPEIDITEEGTTVVVTTADDRTHFIDMEGKKWSKDFVQLSRTSDFLTANVLGSSVEENVFLTQNKVYVFNNKEKLFDYDFSDEVRMSDIFTVQLTGKDTKSIGAFSQSGNEIYLLKNYGQIHPDFPIQARTPFVIADLFGIGDDILIAGGIANNVFAYKVND
ncbi:MAG: hypothetical protein R3E32_10735 [Chitinophagales bacterium]